MSIRVLIAEDHAVVRDGLRALLEAHSGMVVVGEAGDGREAVEQCLEKQPDVVIMDVMLPELNGIEATRRILAEQPQVRVLALSMHADRRYVKRMFQAGARGYLLKDDAFEELVTGIENVMAGRPALSPRVADIVIDDYAGRGGPEPAGGLTSLTTREREVLQLLAEGASTRETAAKLSLSIKTVETHRQKIMNRLNIRSIAGLTKYAIREGLTDLES